MTEPADDCLSVLIPTKEGFKSSILNQGHDVEISIDFDGSSPESTLALARKVVTDVQSNDDKCRSRIADELLDSYNDGWRMGEAVQPDGSMKPFEHPRLDKPQFCDRLALASIEVTGDETAALSYECGDLFWGHSLSITAFDGARFEDVHVQMLG
jgi:hypothetical protein